MDFMEVANALDMISMTHSSIGKRELLVNYGENVPGFKEVLKYIYDPYFTTGLKQRKLDNNYAAMIQTSAESVMKYLRENNTGSQQAAEFANAFIYQSDDPTWQWAATGLVTKDLQIGVSVTTLNKVFGAGFIPKIGIMRGMPCPDDAAGTYICTEKIDGNRRLIFVNEDGTVDIYTRSGHPDNGLTEIEEEAKRLCKGYVYDCECVAIGEFEDNIALRQATASVLNRRSGTKTGIKALCFDMLPIYEYKIGMSKLGGLARKYKLAKHLGDMKSCRYLEMQFPSLAEPLHMASVGLNTIKDLKYIAALPVLGIARCKQEALDLAAPIWETGGEGVMMLEMKAAYEVNPNPRKTLLKIKATKEYTLQCIGVKEGTGKYTGLLGAITVAYPCNGGSVSVDVGSGFADYMRAEYWKNPERIVGKLVEIDSFGESKNQDGGVSLNCPIFKRIASEVD